MTDEKKKPEEEVSEEELEDVAGGAFDIPDVTLAPPGGVGPTPIPYPNLAPAHDDETTDGGTEGGTTTTGSS